MRVRGSPVQFILHTQFHRLLFVCFMFSVGFSLNGGKPLAHIKLFCCYLDILLLYSFSTFSLMIYDWQQYKGYHFKYNKKWPFLICPMKLSNCHPIWQGQMIAIRVPSFQLHFGLSFSPSDYAGHLSGRR